MLPRLASGNLLERGFRIRRGTAADVDACDRIARKQPRGTLPYISKVSLRDSAAKRELHVAAFGDEVIGFARFHTRRDGWTTLYDLATDLRYQGLGVGRNLLYSVPQPTRLKCPVASTVANTFYTGAGFRLTESDGKLNTYELRVLTIFCAGGNRVYPDLARQSRMAFGARSDYPIYDYPFMVDVPFKDFSWLEHGKVLYDTRPVFALALDYERREQKIEILRQIRRFKNWGILRIAVCCKFDGAVKDIPADVMIAVSVPSQYAGFLPSDLSEYRGRRLHLLGGTPIQWLDLIPKLQGVGATVMSADGSSHETAAKKGTHFEAGKWRNYGKRAEYAHTVVYSGREIVRAVNAVAGSEQRSLFAA